MTRRFKRSRFFIRRIALPLSGFLIALLMIGVLLPPLIDWNSRKPEIERALSALSGKPVSIKGNVGIKLLPTPSLDLGQLVSASETSGVRMEADRLLVELQLFSLLQGRIDITGAVLDHPVFTLLETPSTGVVGGQTQPEPIISSVPRAAAQTVVHETDGSLFGSAKLSVLNGEVRRALNGAKVVGFSFDMDYARSKGQITGNGALTNNGRVQKLRFSIDELGSSGGDHLKVLIDDELASASVVVDGRARFEPGGSSGFEGTVDAIGSIALWNADRPRSLSWRAQSHILASGTEARFERMEGTLGTTPFQNSFTGEGKIHLGKTLDLRLAIKSELLDLDRLIGVGAPPVVPPFDAFSEIQQLFGQKTKTPNTFDFHADVSVDRLRTGNDDIRGFRFVASGRGDAWTIEQAAGDLPGGARMAIKGTPLETLSIASILSGHLSIDVADQRRFFGWIDGQPAVPAGINAAKTERVLLDADAIFEPKSLWLPKMTISFGGSRFSGDARYVFPLPPKPEGGKRDRGRISAHLGAPLVDLSVFPMSSFGETPYASPDLDLDLSLDRLTFKALQANALKLAFRRDGDRRSIESLAVDDLAGARIEASGLVEPKGTSGRLAIRSTRLDALAQMMQALTPGVLADLLALRAPYLSPGNVDVSAVLASESGERVVHFEAKGDLDQTKLVASGDWQTGPSSRRNRVDLAFDAGDQVKLMRQLGFNGRLGTVVEPGQLTIKADGNIARGYDIILVAKAAQARMDVTGKLIFTSPTAPFDSKMVLTAPDVARLGSVLGANAALVSEGTEAKIAGRLIASPDRILLTEATVDIAGKAGRIATVTGETAVHFDEKPRLAGQLKADYLNGRWLATVPLGSPDAPSASTGASGWSVTPFGAAQPPTLSGAVWIEVDKLAVTPDLAFDGAQFVLRVKPDLLAFENAEIRFGGGRITGGLTVAREGPTAALQSALTATDVETRRLSTLPLSTRLNGSITLTGKGTSPDELVRSIAGEGSFGLGDIRFDTIDVNALTKPPTATLGVDANASPSAQLDGTMKSGALLAPSGTLPVTVADGMIKLGPLPLATPSGLTLSEASFNLATLQLMATTRIETKTGGSEGSPPQALVTWSGTLDRLHRTVEAEPPRVELKNRMPDNLPIGSSLPKQN